MLQPGYVRVMAEYGAWMNGHMLDLCGGLSEEARRRDMGAFFKSVHGTFDHIVFGDVAWMGRFTGSAMPAKPAGEITFESWPDLDAARRALDQRIIAWAGSVTVAWLTEPMTYTSGIDGRTRTLPRWVLVTHMFNHGTHHRGQLSTLMKQLGVDPGTTDLPWLPRLYDGSLIQGTAQL